MKLDAADLESLQPLIEAAVIATIAQVNAANQRVKGGRLAYTESEAAALIGVNRHVLRDRRLRKEIRGSRVGSRIVYDVDELKRFLKSVKE